ncbi:MAG: hypothetical protein HWQ41_31120 [Nostoc sp. NOS(2021)]|uniref:hypothetical protein n=1 Tax=Nostoc sp. NOS(2021) TaxID=2815407 RepID=UPI0025EB0B69|nr:hypothetical protein [Nostoc sp. NOS(2021)]MBN3899559.1 hypothetical protein [Nostoc sp. NOS(2021)]
MHRLDAPNPNKVSPEFASRLTNLEPQQKVRVIVLLQVQDAQSLANKRQSPNERQAVIQAVQKSAEQALGNIIGIIQNFDGRSLTEHPDLFGSISLEITVAGVNALAESEAVKAVIEDQSIYPISRK